MKNVKVILAGLIASLFLLSPNTVYADLNDFPITSFESNITLTNKDPQGQARIVENISVNFTDQNHGITRAIPASYKGHPLQLKINKISSSTGALSEYSTYNQNGNVVIKIGSPDQTVTGPQEYTIDYTVDNVISFYNDHDEFYWDINGDQSEHITYSVKATINLPNGLTVNKSPVCYSGSYNSTVQDCLIKQSNNKIISSTTQPLDYNQTLTNIVGFNKGYFAAPTLKDNIQDKMANGAKFLLPFLALSLLGFGLWISRGRDEKGSGTIVPEYQPPAGLKPLSVGTLIDFKMDNKDITATIIDLAVRKYIKIIETTKSKLLIAKDKSYSLRLTNPDFTQLDNYEAQIMARFFPGAQKDSIVDLKDKKNDFYTLRDSLDKAVNKNLTKAGYFKKDPRNYSASKVISALILAAIGIIYFGSVLGAWLSAGIIAGLVMLSLFYKKLGARTRAGTLAKDQILGLKMYMEVAEKDRIEKLQSPNAAYNQTAEPVRTVELFEKLLPYAVALGVEKKWAGQFEGLYTSPPDWYRGNWTSFNAGYMAGSISEGMNGAVGAAFTAPTSSGSSGFSGGGGFAGGGGGGGGVGGW